MMCCAVVIFKLISIGPVQPSGYARVRCVVNKFLLNNDNEADTHNRDKG